MNYQTYDEFMSEKRPGVKLYYTDKKKEIWDAVGKITNLKDQISNMKLLGMSVTKKLKLLKKGYL